MNPEIKERWIAALLSGDYKQGQHSLCQVDDRGNRFYCCLGVLSDLAVKDGIAKETEPEEDSDGGLYVSYESVADPERDVSSWFPADYIQEWAGLETDDPYVTINGHRLHLGEANDDGETFATIAEAIREHL